MSTAGDLVSQQLLQGVLGLLCAACKTFVGDEVGHTHCSLTLVNCSTPTLLFLFLPCCLLIPALHPSALFLPYRAGRYASGHAEGFVCVLNPDDLSLLREALATATPQVTQACLLPRYGVVANKWSLLRDRGGDTGSLCANAAAGRTPESKLSDASCIHAYVLPTHAHAGTSSWSSTPWTTWRQYNSLTVSITP